MYLATPERMPNSYFKKRYRRKEFDKCGTTQKVIFNTGNPEMAIKFVLNDICPILMKSYFNRIGKCRWTNGSELRFLYNKRDKRYEPNMVVYLLIWGGKDGKWPNWLFRWLQLRKGNDFPLPQISLMMWIRELALQFGYQVTLAVAQRKFKLFKQNHVVDGGVEEIGGNGLSIEKVFKNPNSPAAGCRFWRTKWNG